nr:hypothetical protein [Tanacetum cinerariifolium]
MISYVTKSDANEGFNKIINFLNGSSIKYALTMNPNIYVSCIKQFWTSVVVKKVNDVMRLQALVDKKKVVVTKATIREALRLDDTEGIECLPNEKIFAELTRMWYEKPSTNLTFYKAFFLSHWKFLIHTILQCISAKRTSWNQFSSSMASAIICLSTGRKFNFSRYIFDSLVRNVDSPTKFYMYPRFLQLMIRKQVGDLSTHSTKYTSSALTQKVFANMRWVGKGFSRVDTPLFEGMLVVHEVGEGDADEVHVEDVNVVGVAARGVVSAADDVVPTADKEPFIPSPTPPTPPPLPSQDQPLTSQVYLTLPQSPQAQPQSPQPQPQPLQDAGISMNLLQNLMDTCTTLTRRVEHLELDKIAQALEITKLKQRVKKLERRNKLKVLSMQEEESEPTKLQEVVDVVTTAKIITEVVTVVSNTITAPSTTITVADVLILAATIVVVPTLTAAPSRRRKGVVIRDPEETTTTSTTIHSKAKSKHKGQGILVEKDDKAVKRYQALKRKPQTEAQARKNMMIYLRNVVGFKMDYFKGMTYDDIRPIFEKHFDSNVAFLQETKERMDEEDSRALKRLNESVNRPTVIKIRKPTSSPRLVDEFIDEGVPENEPRFDDEEANLQREVEESLKGVYATHWGPLPPVVFKEPDSRRRQPLPEKSTTGQYILQRRTPEITDQTGPSNHHENEKATRADVKTYTEELLTHTEKLSKEMSNTVVLGTESGGQDEKQGGPDPEHEILKELASSTRTLSSLQHLTKDFSFGDQFFNDKPSEAENEKTTIETEAESMVSVTIQQDTFAIPPMTTSVIGLTCRPDSPNAHQPLPATATETAMTTTTTHPPPPQPQQISTYSILIKRIDELEQIMENLIQDNKHLEERLDRHGSSNEDTTIYKALEKSMARDQTNQFLTDLAEAQRNKKMKNDSPKTPPGSPPHQPPPHPPPAGPSETLGSYGDFRSSQVPPPPPLPPSINQEGQSHGSTAPSSSKTAASAKYIAWMTSDIRFKTSLSSIPKDLHMDDDSAPDEQVHSSDDEDIRNDYISAFHKLLTDKVDDALIKYNVSKPLPLGGHPGQVIIQTDFFFNKYLEYLRYGSKGGRHALSISNMKAAYYHDVALEQMVPDQIHISEGDRKAIQTHIRILSVVRVEVLSLYGDKYEVQMIMRFNEIHKFSDGTLHQIDEELYYRVKEFKVNRMNLVGFNSLVHSLRALSTLRNSDLRTASTAVKPCQGDSLEFYQITGSIHID